MVPRISVFLPCPIIWNSSRFLHDSIYVSGFCVVFWDLLRHTSWPVPLWKPACHNSMAVAGANRALCAHSFEENGASSIPSNQVATIWCNSFFIVYIYIDRLMTSSNEYFSRTAWFSRNLEVSSRNWIPPGQEWFVSSVRFAVLVGYKKKSMLGLQSQIESVKGSGELQ